MAETNIVKSNSGVDINKGKRLFVKPVGSFIGFVITVAIGLTIYFILEGINASSSWLPYGRIVSYTAGNGLYKLIWMTMNFTEAQFYAGICASLGVILGGFIAWRLDVKKSKAAGFNICYGTNLWPWIFISQLLSIILSIFLLDYTRFFDQGGYTWLPTFISIVGVPPVIMLIYGPGIRALLTGSILGGLMSFPVAFWVMARIIPVLEVPGVVGSVFTMAVTEIIALEVCRALPWMKKNEPKTILANAPSISSVERLSRMSKPSWFIRRVFADFSEAQFYGNEIAGLMVIIGVCLDWVLNAGHPAYGSGAVPAIILSQFAGSATGVFLYFNKFVENGGYATFIPVVSVGPACVLSLGATIPVALTAGILGGITGGPVADYLVKKLPQGLHPAIGNVTSMGICTMVVYSVMKVLPWL